MEISGYKPRLVDGIIDDYLDAMGAVVIEGPKWCGKTWTSRRHSSSEYLVGSADGNFQNKRLAELAPSVVLAGETPRMIDEWQEVPLLWDAVRAEVDNRNARRQFILTGSSTPQRKGIVHSGAGRIGRIRMRPMSLYEAGVSSGSVSLSALTNGEFVNSLTGDVNLETLTEAVVRGGWPGNLSVISAHSGILAKEYIKALIESDFQRVDIESRRNVHKMHLLLKSLARNESTTVSIKTLKRDIDFSDHENIDEDTIMSYLEIFRRMFIVDNQLPYSPDTRSSLRIKQAEKRHLADPSLTCSLLNMNAAKLISDLETFGFLFEALCERDLRIYSNVIGGELYHYQDYKNNEIDAVIELTDKRWCAIEIKLGANQIDDAAKNLVRINNELRETGGKPADFMIVICGLSNAAYKRNDGVYVIPITALKN